MCEAPFSLPGKHSVLHLVPLRHSSNGAYWAEGQGCAFLSFSRPQEWHFCSPQALTGPPLHPRVPLQLYSAMQRRLASVPTPTAPAGSFALSCPLDLACPCSSSKRGCVRGSLRPSWPLSGSRLALVCLLLLPSPGHDCLSSWPGRVSPLQQSAHHPPHHLRPGPSPSASALPLVSSAPRGGWGPGLAGGLFSCQPLLPLAAVAPRRCSSAVAVRSGADGEGEKAQGAAAVGPAVQWGGRHWGGLPSPLLPAWWGTAVRGWTLNFVASVA